MLLYFLRCEKRASEWYRKEVSHQRGEAEAALEEIADEASNGSIPTGTEVKTLLKEYHPIQSRGSRRGDKQA